MRIFIAIVLCLSIRFAGNAQEIKIGYANVDYIFSKLPEVKKIESDLKVLQTNLENRIETNYFDFSKEACQLQRRISADGGTSPCR